jgi:uncharacterized iron-regulated protein
MKYNKLIILVAVMTVAMAMRSDKPAYQFFDIKGKKADYGDLLKAAGKSDIVFFGEMHDSPICHWLELELTKDLYAEKTDKLVLGMEMFEADNQLLLNEYLNGTIKEKSFEDEARLWKNYKTDYKPIVKFAFDHHIPLIATNVPRRYATLVNKAGFTALDSLSLEAKKLIPPLPILYDPELPGYKSMVDMMRSMDSSHVTDNIAKAQALKDATMAYFILQNYKPGGLFLHFNGSYHTENFEGIVWYIKQARPDLNVLTIASAEQDDIDTLSTESIGIADFVLTVPSSMTKTFISQ